MQHYIEAFLQAMGVLATGGLIGLGILKGVWEIAKAQDKRRKFKQLVNRLEFSVNAHRTQLELARKVMEIISDKVLEIKDLLDHTRQSMLNQRDTIIRLEDRLKLAEDELVSLRRAVGEDAIDLHNLTGRIDRHEQNTADLIYNLQNRVTGLEIKSKGKAA
jgi:chromosome segregation ATPase